MSTIRLMALFLIAATLCGCVHESANAAALAAMHSQCGPDGSACANEQDSRTVVQCQSGDRGACQKIAVKRCDGGDAHVCESLAVVHAQLQPLCNGGNRPACDALGLPWPDSATWHVDQQISQARQACKSGDGEACRALGLMVRPAGDQLVWMQSYVAPAPKQTNTQ